MGHNLGGEHPFLASSGDTLASSGDTLACSLRLSLRALLQAKKQYAFC